MGQEGLHSRSRVEGKEMRQNRGRRPTKAWEIDTTTHGGHTSKPTRGTAEEQLLLADEGLAQDTGGVGQTYQDGRR